MHSSLGDSEFDSLEVTSDLGVISTSVPRGDSESSNSEKVTRDFMSLREPGRLGWNASSRFLP
jgi:hypothetical protein